MYEHYFNLREAPFQLRPDPRFFFGSAGHTRAVSYLTFGLSQGEGFVVVTGEVGTGKTTLVGHLLASLDKSRFIPTVVVTTQLSGDDLLRLIAKGFGVDCDDIDKAKLLGRLHARLRLISADGRRPLIVVDEAQSLRLEAIEELRMLSNLELEGEISLQTILLGQPQFRERIAHADLAQLRQRAVVMYHLEPLSGEETRDYALHRLRHAGWNGNPPIDDEVFETVFSATGGVPRLINVMFSRILLSAFLESSAQVTSSVAKQVAEDMRVEFGGAPAPRRKTRTSLKG